ncbi:hypothetical protein BATDEDRAFT_92472 [Batrachochytrium dendrobatidis JAM81]|uniref:Mitochondrial intermembrane space import and assembly protein 40 n=2 Tax=Batrachochytrium dendrobatidis TaxID=109871 RepID=F4PDH9_BATDJ|nr:uncharacterized protein BATDEDRAFT_92472 [Batrachochytrium dendrobatidis JAM81]EGF76681.1 hypothetical protein BATDEDRAFT_92472 [Batrachochytrium dendrobatidis JAM81]KAJ8329362.1 Oxidoreductase [Batrachochytrium dendrobatidis]KAK5666884.1 Oxidoreductase [Batrachochytrium dendrobatidis]OAJ45236.1 hypothetical protein BDEG_28389 [Batrachochytrium dendrobatidis JEL423]|eukprot:XP_006682686.1 hypothetical protein BATDEDRAFT_92472 [Batrachochytrium dendrobatidis JAM81]
MSYTRTEEDGKDTIMFLSPADTFAKTTQQPLDASTAQQEAYNEETGEINWDCPCLGPMTQPPCGETFKAAFSCFVYSKEEPKGIDCVDQFRAMQACFREHPEVYGDELDEDDQENATNVDEQPVMSDNVEKQLP